MPKKYIVRLISSADHAIPKEKLLEIIKTTGTDRYDSARLQMFDDFYGKHAIDFFGTEEDSEDLEATIKDLAEKFPERTYGDRGRRVVPDIAILYAADKCEMIENVYDYQVESDCYRFKTNAKDALEEVREI